MKPLLVLMSCALLAACSAAPQAPSVGQDFPAAVTHLDMTLDAETAQVDVHVTAKSSFPRTLKTLRIVVALYDAAGAQVGTDQDIEILGPIKNGQSIGPLEKVTSVRDRSVSCVGVVKVEAVMMDYATRSVSGKEANALVTDNHFKRCTRASA